MNNKRKTDVEHGKQVSCFQLNSTWPKHLAHHSDDTVGCAHWQCNMLFHCSNIQHYKYVPTMQSTIARVQIVLVLLGDAICMEHRAPCTSHCIVCYKYLIQLATENAATKKWGPPSVVESSAAILHWQGRTSFQYSWNYSPNQLKFVCLKLDLSIRLYSISQKSPVTTNKRLHHDWMWPTHRSICL